MKSILDLLRRPVPTSADLRATLAALPADDEATIAALERDRRSALIEGAPVRDIERIDRKIADAKIERDRAIAFREEMTARLAVAEKVEAVDALAFRKEAAERESEAIAAEYEAFDSLLDRLTGMIRRAGENHAACSAIDAELIALGSTDRVHQAPRYNPGIVEGHIARWMRMPAPQPTSSEQTQ